MLSDTELIGRLLLGAALGSVIGFERERLSWAAGLRTHMLVCVGSILLRGEVVRGLTTAASLWSVAAIGLAVGGGMYVASIASTIIILIILAGLKPLEQRYIVAKQERRMRLLVDHRAVNLNSLSETLGSGGSRIKKFVVQPSESSEDIDEVHITLSRVTPTQYHAIRRRLKATPGVREVQEDVS